MTVAVLCNLADGVILGVDSAITFSDSKGRVAKVYENAEKLFQLGEKPVGLANFGMAMIRSRSIGTYVREFELEDPNHVVSRPASMKKIVEELRKFFTQIYKNTVITDFESQTGKKFTDLPDRQKPFLGLVVGGFSAKEFLSEVWEIRIPFHDKPNSALQRRGQGDFGGNWFATYKPIQRFIKGCDWGLLNELKQYFVQLRKSPLTSKENTEIKKIVKKYEYRIPFPAMPIGEGIAHVKFLVELVINHFRFAIGAPVVGGKARIGLVTYKGDKFKILEGG